MSFIRKQIINGRTYAYNITSYWDKEKKISRQKSEYLGVFDNDTGEIKPKNSRNYKSYIVWRSLSCI